MKILIVEDENIIAQAIKEELEKWNYQVDIATNFQDIIEEFKKSTYNLVLLDIILPNYNGYYWCEQIRKISNVPIIFISSKTEDMDIVMAIQFGADDYITKPINLDIITAKVQAILRRTYQLTENINRLTYEKISLDIGKCTLEYENQQIELTKTELQILQELIKEQGKIVTRTKIMDCCWQNDNYIDDNTLAVNISRLRKKLKTINIENLIQTKKGIGYYLINPEGENE